MFHQLGREVSLLLLLGICFFCVAQLLPLPRLWLVQAEAMFTLCQVSALVPLKRTALSRLQPHSGENVRRSRCTLEAVCHCTDMTHA